MKNNMILILCILSNFVTAQNMPGVLINNSSLNAIFTFGFVNKMYLSNPMCDCDKLALKSKQFEIKQDTSVFNLFSVEAKRNKIRKHAIDVFCNEKRIGRIPVVTLNPPTPSVNVFGHIANLRAAIPYNFDSIEVSNTAEYNSLKKLNFEVLSYDIEFFDSLGLVRKSKGYGKYIPKEEVLFFKTNIYKRGFYVAVKNIRVKLEHKGDVLFFYQEFEIKRNDWYTDPNRRKHESNER